MESTEKAKRPRNRKRQTISEKVKDEFHYEVGDRLRRIRLKEDITQERMAEILRVTTSFYGRVERGENSLSMDKLCLLREQLNVDLNYLITGKEIEVIRIDYEFQNVPRKMRNDVEELLKTTLNLVMDRENR